MVSVRRLLIATGAAVLVAFGAGTPMANAASDITIEQGDTITVRLPGVDRVTPAHVTWGDGASSDVRTKCRTATARKHPRNCIAKARHTYTSAGAFTVTSTRKGRTLTIGVVTVQSAENSGGTPAPAPSGWQQDMLDQVNALRAAAGAAPLRLCTPLTKAAQDYSQAMADQKFFDHTGKDGSTVGTRAAAAGYNWTAVGENIAYGQTSVTQVVTAWKNSPGHYANMVNPQFTDVGFGEASSAGNSQSPLWTQDFGAGGTC